MKRSKRGQILLLCLLCALLCVACGGADDGYTPQTFTQSMKKQEDTTSTETETKEETQQPVTESVVVEEELPENQYMVTLVDTIRERIRLYSYDQREEYECSYDLSTSFLDKYGNSMSVAKLQQGMIVHLGAGRLSRELAVVQISDKVWEYDNVVRYTIDVDRSLFKIVEEKFSWDKRLQVFANGKKIAITEIGPKECIRVVGIGQKILSIRVVSGNGMLQLDNTELFEGSYLQLGDKMFFLITEDMSVEVPEGMYTLVVANNGWGGSQQVVITRGETTHVDLDLIKGEGPKMGTVAFTVEVEGTEIFIDGKEIDYSEPISLTYGEHLITVRAEGHDSWTRKLYINSEECTIVIGFDNDEDEEQEAVQESRPQNNRDDEDDEDEDENSDNERDEDETAPERTQEDDEEDIDALLTPLLNSLNDIL